MEVLIQVGGVVPDGSGSPRLVEGDRGEDQCRPEVDMSNICSGR